MSWLSGYDFRKSHTISGSTAGAQTNYQVGIKVYYGSGTDGTETIDSRQFGSVYCDSQCKADFGDIRFTKENGADELDYFIEAKTDGNSAVIWVEIDTIPAAPSTKTIYLYYGKNDATTTTNPTATFPFYDDFSTYRESWDGGTVSNGTITTNGVIKGTLRGTVTEGKYALIGKISNTSGAGTFGLADANNFVRGVSRPHYYYSGIAWDGDYYDGNPTSYGNFTVNWGTSYHDVWSLFGSTSSTSGFTGRIDSNYLHPSNSKTLSGNTPLYVRLGVDTSSFTISADLIKVQAYVYPEPTHGSWGDVESPSGSVANQSSFLRFKRGDGVYALCVVPNGQGANNMGGIPKVRKDGVTYDIYLVETNDTFASPVRIKTSAGTKAIRYYTAHSDSVHSDVAHSDTGSPHSDVPFSNVVHSDVSAYSDWTEHYDYSDTAHSDVAHSDTSSTHSDTAFSNVAHSDTQPQYYYDAAHYWDGYYHLDASGGTPIEHYDYSDTPHSDVVHSDASSHSDTLHSDVAHSDTQPQGYYDQYSWWDQYDHTNHQNVPFTNIAHSDVSHSDYTTTHSDTPHSDAIHSDTAEGIIAF